MRQTFVISVVLVAGLASAPALAQVDESPAASQSDAGYAWGEGARAGDADDPLRIMGFLGAGVGFRLLRNLDFNQDFVAPAYLDLGAAVFLPGGDIRHGVGLGLTATLTADAGGAVDPLGQWGVTPSYYFLVPLRRIIDDMDHDWVHIQGRFGIPLVFSAADNGVDVSIGGELAAAVHFKFLAGLGLYLEVTGALYGGSKDTVHPVIGIDAGLLFDYEVLQ